MSRRLNRRTFLRRLALGGLAAPALSASACADPPAAAGEGPGPTRTRRSIRRPVIRRWSGDGVRIEAPLGALPMAYVSRARREVFVDYTFREQSRWMLDAHISVSTGVWRIPLPGDPVRRPIQPGDTMREFEELDIAEWDPALEPAEGDFRLVHGAPEPATIDFRCVPMSGAVAWFSGGPWEIRRCGGVGVEACREDFVEVGIGLRHPIRGCVEEGVTERFLTWLCHE